MICTQAESMMIDALYGELGSADNAQLTAHLASCPDCQARLGRLRSVLGTMDGWTDPPATGRIAASAVRRVIGDGVAPPSGVRQVLGRFCADVQGAHPRRLIGVRQQTLQTAAWLAVTAAAIGIALRMWLPVSSVVDICDRWIHTSLGFVPFALVLLFIAAAFSAGPLFVGGLVFLRGTRTYGFAANAMCFAIYSAVVAPLVYHQCLSLPVPVQGLWIAGTVLGAALASAAGIRWVRRRSAFRKNGRP